jgi:hypothetical protein
VDLSWDGGATWDGYVAVNVNNNTLTIDTTTFTPSVLLSMKDIWAIHVRLRANVSEAKEVCYVNAVNVVPFYTSTKFNLYSARNFKGSFCLDSLQKMQSLESFHWAEDHALEVITLVKPDDFEDTGVDLNRTDYDDDWEFIDKSNSINSVTVFGSAEFEISATSNEGDPDSPIHSQIIDEGVRGYSVAFEMAKAQALLFASKRPQLRLTLNGTQASLKVGEKVHITLEQPDGTDIIAQTFYEIRKLIRFRRGRDGIKTMVYCGLGEGSDDERIAIAIQKASILAHDAHLARIVQAIPHHDPD